VLSWCCCCCCCCCPPAAAVLPAEVSTAAAAAGCFPRPPQAHTSACPPPCPLPPSPPPPPPCCTSGAHTHLQMRVAWLCLTPASLKAGSSAAGSHTDCTFRTRLGISGVVVLTAAGGGGGGGGHTQLMYAAVLCAAQGGCEKAPRIVTCCDTAVMGLPRVPLRLWVARAGVVVGVAAALQVCCCWLRCLQGRCRCPRKPSSVYARSCVHESLRNCARTGCCTKVRL
jgi:hypothetical protein